MTGLIFSDQENSIRNAYETPFRTVPQTLSPGFHGRDRLIHDADGGMVPRGPSGGNYTFVMTGASATPFIVSAIQKGIVTENLPEIYEALKGNHMPGGIMGKSGYEHNTKLGGGLEHYIRK